MRYEIRFTGSYKPEQIEALQAVHTAMVSALAESIEPSAQGSFGIDQAEGLFSAAVVGEATGDHLASVRSAFEVGKTGLVAIDADLVGKFTYTGDEGEVVVDDFPKPIEEVVETPTETEQANESVETSASTE